MTENIICFGEMLWDMLPSGKQPGGAPMNVAVHLKNLGLQVSIISRVGDDELGKELLDFLSEKNIDTSLIQQGQTHLTGVVKANVDNKNEVTYKIVHPVAWDYIQLDETSERAVEDAAVFIFGSLAARSESSQNTLHHLLKKANLKVFDVNLRPPYYNQETVEYLLKQADFVKMNHNELAEISSWYEEYADENQAMANLIQQYDLKALCVTKGENGAKLWQNGKFYDCKGFKVEVKDTIGSGDSFLAALLKGYLNKTEPSENLLFACATGSLVATYLGATPAISESQIQSFILQSAPNHEFQV
ncbi:fructokinase [Pseudarcicella hirudinis]|uniref:Fructokinase n=1 Tax=Pseudarcicella hirudinis TaxID=1079859 RepID=A0A1I5PBQ9_9BACT|nr:carbohydrate kinase [Pseudarcicella hirudinis]SFP30951.1 fructokinase [Pseudarcicella hirudinis]